MSAGLAVGGLLALTMLVFVRHLFGHWTFPWDFSSFYTATPPFVASTIGHGHLLSWSPFVASGFPVDVNPQAGIYFPLWWVFGALGVTLNLTAVTAIQVAQVCFGAVGVLVLCRVRRLGWSWAMTAAVAYLLFGGFFGEAEHGDYVRGFAYLPWLLWSLTPPPPGRTWLRLAALPPIVWLIATGAYPAQIASFSIVSLVYLVAAVRQSGRGSGDLRWLVVAVGASVLACLAVLYPYLLAQHLNQLARVHPPTAPVRAHGALGPTDIFGLYLNSFAWHRDGSVTAWGVAVPVLIGLAFATLRTMRRQRPVALAGATALILATTPKIGPIGHAMAALGPLFPSRFPAADYKSAVALALVILSAEAWSASADRRGPRSRVAALIGAALIVGAILAPSHYAPVTRLPWLLGLVVLGSVALAWLRPRAPVLAILLIFLVAVDGGRQAISYKAVGGASAWEAPPANAAMYRARDSYIADLPSLLRRAPAERPARVPEFDPSYGPTGDGPDASGWVADGYHLISYGGTVERTLVEALANPVWSRLLEEPWHAYVFPCRPSGCGTPQARLPSASRWRVSGNVRTLSYGAGVIVYAVHLSHPAVMVENELAISGWLSGSDRAKLVATGTPFRGWRLAPGTYRFTARYQQPGRPVQESAAALAFVAWIGLLTLLARRRRRELSGTTLRG